MIWESVNTYASDTQHISIKDGLKFKARDPMDMIERQQWGFRMQIETYHRVNKDLASEAGIFGTSTFFQQGTVDGWWLGIAAEDKPILDSIHHRVGCLTKPVTSRSVFSGRAIHLQILRCRFEANRLRNAVCAGVERGSGYDHPDRFVVETNLAQ